MAQFLISAFADEADDLLDGQIEALHRNGLYYIEPRSVGGNLIKKTNEEILEIATRLRQEGIGISALGSPIGKYNITDPFEDHLKDFRRALAICKMLGATRMRMFSFFTPQDQLQDHRDEVLRRMEILLDEAKQAGVQLCHENESHIYGQNPPQVKDLLDTFPTLGGIFDAANYVRQNQDPIEGYEATEQNLVYLHIKDARFSDRAMVPVGLGDGQYEEILRRVDAHTDGTVFLTVEPHLFQFQAYKSIDSLELKHDLYFETADEAFDCAVEHLKKLLTKIGFHQEENGLWKK